MPYLLDFSRFILSRRRRNDGQNSIPGGGDYLFSLGIENGPKFGVADASYIEDGNVYSELLGWQVGDFARISQDIVDLPDNGIKFEAIIQSPDVPPEGFSWIFQVLTSDGIDEKEIFSRTLSQRKKRLTVFLPSNEIIGYKLIFQLKFSGV